MSLKSDQLELGFSIFDLLLASLFRNSKINTLIHSLVVATFAVRFKQFEQNCH